MSSNSFSFAKDGKTALNSGVEALFPTPARVSRRHTRPLAPGDFAKCTLRDATNTRRKFNNNPQLAAHLRRYAKAEPAPPSRPRPPGVAECEPRCGCG